MPRLGEQGAWQTPLKSSGTQAWVTPREPGGPPPSGQPAWKGAATPASLLGHARGRSGPTVHPGIRGPRPHINKPGLRALGILDPGSRRLNTKRTGVSSNLSAARSSRGTCSTDYTSARSKPGPSSRAPRPPHSCASSSAEERSPEPAATGTSPPLRAGQNHYVPNVPTGPLVLTARSRRAGNPSKGPRQLVADPWVRLRRLQQ